MANRNSKKRDRVVPEFVAEGTLHGLQFYDQVQDLIDYDKPLTCTPNITLLNSNQQAIFDYTDCVGVENEEYLGNILGGLSGSQAGGLRGDGITLTNGIYIDSVRGEECDLTGSFTFDTLRGKLIIANVVSVASVESYDKRYKKEYFTDIPDIRFFPSKTSDTKRNVIKNVFGSDTSPSFNSIGARVNDYLQFLDGDNQDMLVKITGISYDTNNHELITVTGANTYDPFYGITQENRFNLATPVRLYRENYNERVPVASSGKTYPNKVQLIPFVSTVDGTGEYAFSVDGSIRPSITLTAGNMYIFDFSSGSNQGLLENTVNSIRISTTSDGGHAGGVIYSTGVTVFDKALVFTPQAAGTFYYYSVNTPRMGGMITVLSADGLTINTVTINSLGNLSASASSNSIIY